MAVTRDHDYRHALVSRIGELIHGPRWIAPLAADLSRVTGRNVGGPQISHYLSSARPFPDWIENGMLRVMQDRTAAILDEGKKLRAETILLETRLASRLTATPVSPYTPPLRGYSSPRMKPEPAPAPEPEPEEDNAPTPSMGM